MQSILSTSFVLAAAMLAMPASGSASIDSNLNRDCGLFAENGAGFNNASKFRLAAFETNGSTIPLDLEINPRLYYLSVVDLYSVNSTVFSLQDGTLYANDTANTIEIANPVSNGSIVSFFRSPELIPTSQFCAIANTDPAGGPAGPALALIGDSSSFSICKTNSTPPASAVVYNASAGSQSYNIDDCAQVEIRLLTLS